MSTARRLAAGLRIFLGHLTQRVLLQLRLGQQPLQSAVLLAQLLELLGRIGIHPAVGAAPVAQRRRRHSQLGGDLLTDLALGSQLVRPPQLAHDVLRGMPLPTSHKFHRPFQPDIGPQDSKTGWTHSAGTRHDDLADACLYLLEHYDTTNRAHQCWIRK
jgi:hypothetical protein